MRGKIRRVQYIISEKLLLILQKSLCALSLTDKGVRAELQAFPEDFTFLLDTGGAAVKLRVKGNRLVKSGGDDDEAADLTITFKDITGAFPVLTGRQSAEGAFAQHRMTVRGEVGCAVVFVRIINIARAYLLPKSVLKKTSARIPEKNGSALAFYRNLVFTKEGAFR